MTLDANGGSDVMIPKTGVHGDYVLPSCEYIAPEGKEFARKVQTAHSFIIVII